MTEPNWLVTLILAAALSIPISIGANLLTPRIQRWFNRRNWTSRAKALERAQNEYKRLKQLHEEPNVLHVESQIMIALALGAILLTVFVDLGAQYSQGPLSDILTQSLTLFAIFYDAFMLIVVFVYIRDLARVRLFDDYERKAIARIAELEKQIAKKP